MQILFCACQQARVYPESVRRAVRTFLDEARLAYTVVDDLCGMAAGKDPRLSRWAQDGEPVILACFPRAVRGLFRAAGAALPESANLFNLRGEFSIESLRPLLQKAVAGAAQEVQTLSDWQPWFPVIDYSRCGNCKQCLNFCLFGVYGLDEEGLVQVVRPSQCKTNCPACARVCPQAAIIFPKYSEKPINGDQVDEADWQKRDIPDTLKQRLAGNIYALLRNREAGRTARPLEDLKTVQKQLDIPEEVLESLRNSEKK